MRDAVETAIGDRGDRPEMVRVWDPFVRIFHWSLVGLFTVAFVTGGEWMRLHTLAGYTIGALVALRIAWAVIGSEQARFANFVYAPNAVLAYLRDALSFRARRYLGHNPAGGAMILALLACLGVIVTTGYMMTTDAYWGIAWVENLHRTTVYLTLVLVALHIGGVILASIEHKENLIRAMITGLKRKS